MDNLENHKYSTIPTTGAITPTTDWPKNHVLPQGKNGSLSTGGWTDNAQGFIQQTFLGASITDFNINAGFGDTSSTLSVKLVNDEFNLSDGTAAGFGDDPYHSGAWLEANNNALVGKGGDMFAPPIPGSPVFFKFGKNPASVEQAFRKTFDDLYRIKTLPSGTDFPVRSYDEPLDLAKENLKAYEFVDLQNKVIVDKSRLWRYDDTFETYDRGRNHFNFGGILQSYTQNKSSAGAPIYSVNVSDPREILSNAVMLFNNYQGSTFNNKNLFNIYGFLEYDPSSSLLQDLNGRALGKGIVAKSTSGVLGEVLYRGERDTTIGVDDPGFGLKPDVDVMVVSEYIPNAGGTPPSPVFKQISVNLKDEYKFPRVDFGGYGPGLDSLPEFFPVTGQGFSRRSDKGIPFYRVKQAINALFEYNGDLPEEYVKAGFGGSINFRGFNYVVDFGGIPVERIPLLYYMDFDQLDMLSFAQELCDIISHELYVTLLPVINHPACQILYERNLFFARSGQPEKMIAGIIRLDAINKTQQPRYGAIKSYIDQLDARGISVENQDVGFELSNVTTDKFVVGGQKVDMYLFNNNKDRDDLAQRRLEAGIDQTEVERLRKDQWHISTQLCQQFLPFYGFIGKDKALSIPKGFGPYQQIVLDADGLDAFGVGKYYITTEMELRAALVSFDRWKEFLLSYNETYVQDVSQYGATYAALGGQGGNDDINKALQNWRELLGVQPGDPLDLATAGFAERKFAVSVPRSVWNNPDKPYMGKDNLPASPCDPPFGYPLYYKRAQKIGIPEAGVVEIQNAVTKVVTDVENLSNASNELGNYVSQQKDEASARIEFFKKKLSRFIKDWKRGNPALADTDQYTQNSEYKSLKKSIDDAKKFYNDYKARIDKLDGAAKKRVAATRNALGVTDKNGKPKDTPLSRMIANLPTTAKFHLKNAQKVYNFVKKVAEENLGKKYLVKIPKVCNARYQNDVVMYNEPTVNIAAGPFGFRPEPINSGTTFVNTLGFQQQINEYSHRFNHNQPFEHYLDYKIDTASGVWMGKTNSAGVSAWGGTSYNDNYSFGALKCNFNPFSENWEYNYKPEPQGGFFDFSLFGPTLLSEAKVTHKDENSLQGDAINPDNLPLAAKQGLLPVDTMAIVEDSNRIKCFAKYDNSHFLDFAGVSPDDLTQQSIDKAGNIVPDIMQSLPNTNPDKRLAFDTIAAQEDANSLLDRQRPSIAFVKCDLDEDFYMPPKFQPQEVDVYANNYEMSISEPAFDIVETKDDNGCPAHEFQVRRATPIFQVADSGGLDGQKYTDVFYNSTLPSGGEIISNKQDLDPNHVYALITVPGRIKSTIDQRWASGPMKAFNTVQIENILTADVTRHEAFIRPAFPELEDKVIVCQSREDQWGEDGFGTITEALASGAARGFVGAHQSDSAVGELGYWFPGQPEDYVELSFTQLNQAQQAQRDVMKGVALNSPEGNLSFTQPSPVYPSMVALPLMSMERCYGPWLSAAALNPFNPRQRYTDVGGKIEFIKDENLTPWNYAGYQLLNEAGRLQADFSNSLLLVSERGGFVYPDAPTGIAIATALQNEGPLITSIGVSVGAGGIKTTVKLDLYTAQYGKLQKQKEGAISQIARERQKVIDQNNNAIRRGLGKRNGNKDLVGSLLATGGSAIKKLASDNADFFSDFEMGKKPTMNIVVDEVSAAVLSDEELRGRLSAIPEELDMAAKLNENAVGSFSDFIIGVGGDHDDPDMASPEYNHRPAINDMIFPDSEHLS